MITIARYFANSAVNYASRPEQRRLRNYLIDNHEPYCIICKTKTTNKGIKNAGVEKCAVLFLFLLLVLTLKHFLFTYNLLAFSLSLSLSYLCMCICKSITSRCVCSSHPRRQRPHQAPPRFSTIGSSWTNAPIGTARQF